MMRLNKPIKREDLRKGIYILPNLFTLMNLFFGFYAIVCAIGGQFKPAAVAILIAAVFDALDGKIARATHTLSRFGAEFDSLADLVSFGVAPAVMMYLWILQPMGRPGWLAAFLFVACGALRLARFNTNLDQSSDGYFVGLPIPAAAGMNAVMVLFTADLGLETIAYHFPALLLMYGLSFLMVSSIKYFSIKKIEMFRSMNFNVLVSMMLILILVAAIPSVSLLLASLAYIASGPVSLIVRRHREKHGKPSLADRTSHSAPKPATDQKKRFL